MDLHRKIDFAIKLLRSIPTDDGPVEISYSGGKDSDVILELAKMAGIPYRAIYKNTTIDPPGTIKHCNGGGVQAIEDIFGKLTYDMNNDAIITPLDKFKGLPHLNEKQKAITDYEGYAPTLYPYEGKWFVSWISSEGDSILDFQADSPEKAIKLAYNHFFGPKCLPDKTCNVASAKPKPAELKYHVGDWVRVVSIDKHGHIGQITDVEIDNDGIFYKITDADGWHFLEKNLEPYTEPEKNHIPNPAKIVDNILKDSFHEHNRLHVAAMAMQGMLSNTTRFSSYEISDLVRISLNCADALLAECESSAQPLCHAKKGGPK